MPILAERLPQLVPCLDAAIRNNPDREELLLQSNLAGSSPKIIGNLLRIFIKEPIWSPLLLPHKTKEVLIPCLRKWENQFGPNSVDPTLGAMSRRTLQGTQRKAENHRPKVLKNWEHCGNPGCGSTSKLRACGRHASYFSEKLFRIVIISSCSRCQTVQYVSI